MDTFSLQEDIQCSLFMFLVTNRPAKAVDPVRVEETRPPPMFESGLARVLAPTADAKILRSGRALF